MRSRLTPVILPFVHLWVARQERNILARGDRLDQAQLADAVALGIEQPERVRVLHVAYIPFPAIRLVETAGRLMGVSLSQTLGLSARYGIFVRSEYRGDRRLLVHELAHTRQYERLGSIRLFLQQYLHECFTAGYVASPLEREAAAAAERLCR